MIVLSGMDDESIALEIVSKGGQDYVLKGDLNAQILNKTIKYGLLRRQLSIKVQKSERKFKDVFNKSPLPIIQLVGEDMTIELVNNATKALYHLSDQDLMGLTDEPDTEGMDPESDDDDGYLHAHDASGASWARLKDPNDGKPSCFGNWKDLIKPGKCINLCWDVNLLTDGDNSQVIAKPAHITIWSGTTSATFRRPLCRMSAPNVRFVVMLMWIALGPARSSIVCTLKPCCSINPPQHTPVRHLQHSIQCIAIGRRITERGHSIALHPSDGAEVQPSVD